MSKRVLLAGLFHETHTFLEGTTSLADFAIRRGDELFESRGDGSPMSGILEVADEAGWDVRPLVHLRATPSPIVEDAVVELFWSEFRTRALPEIQRGVDGIALVLHGAMVTESIEDVEGELIDRIRDIPGAGDLPICGVLDLHGNISRKFFERSDGFVAYRSNPHADARDAAVSSAKLLDRILATGQRPACLFLQPGIVWPPTGTGTADDPMRTLEAMAREFERAEPDLFAVNIFAGFSFADTADTGVSFSAITFGEPVDAWARLDELCKWAVAHREFGNVVPPKLDEIMPRVLSDIAARRTPVAIVEPADNIGGGAPGDGTSILRAFLRHRVANCCVIINDPDAVVQLSDRSIGENVQLSIGGRGSRIAEGPVELDIELVSRSDGKFDLEDRQSHLASMSGVHIEMGPCAVVRHVGVTILLTSRKTPPFDLGQLRSQGIEPALLAAIGVKAAVAHRRAYDPIVKSSYTVSTPGPCSSDVCSFPFRRIRRPVYPLDPV
jgi:microcystin degradation protein MlrC